MDLQSLLNESDGEEGGGEGGTSLRVVDDYGGDVGFEGGLDGRAKEDVEVRGVAMDGVAEGYVEHESSGGGAANEDDDEEVDVSLQADEAGGPKGGTKEFFCDECFSLFATKANLKVHKLNVHMGLQPHECEFCGRRFGTNSSMRRHQRILHKPERIFECCHCQKSFATRSCIRRHYMRVHSMSKDAAEKLIPSPETWNAAGTSHAKRAPSESGRLEGGQNC